TIDSTVANSVVIQIFPVSHLFKFRREVPQHRRRLDDAQTAQALSLLENLDDRFDHVIDMALRVNAAWDGEAHQFHGGPGRVAGVGIDRAEHYAANLDGTDAGVTIKSAHQRLARKLIGGNMRGKGGGVK